MPVAAIPLFILLIPIFDTAFVSVTRRLAGRSPLHGGRDHLSHRLVALGIDERRAVLALYLLAALGGLIALSLQHADVGYAAILIALYIILLAGIGIVLGHVEAHAVDAETVGAAARLGSRVSEPLVRSPARSGADLARLLCGVPVPVPGRRVRALPDLLRGVFSARARVPDGGPGDRREVPAGLARRSAPRELVGIIKGVWIGVASSALVILYLPYRFEGFSRLVFAIDAVVLRLSARRRARRHHLDRRVPAPPARGGQPILIYGAGARRRAAGADAARGSVTTRSRRSASSTTTRRSGGCGWKACRCSARSSDLPALIAKHDDRRGPREHRRHSTGRGSPKPPPSAASAG